ncbi:hypothetical protein ACHAW5_006277 [Stephanodiscus triporus]|uniref:Peptidase M14 domain-containing protein n=1 Tax=Stephanodiscus triporus TaxID=2934178 RepID=A0ABD3NU79_9STRA
MEPGRFSRFPAEVDLIGFDHLASDKIATISFIVHDEDELARLTLLAKEPGSMTIGGEIELDPVATEDLRKQIEYKYEVAAGEFALASTSAYPTIANYPCYKNLQGSFQWMDDMVVKAQTISGLSVTKLDIGDSWYKTDTLTTTTGYDMFVLRVTGTQGNVATKAPFFIMSGIHAREMTPPELTSRWVQSLIEGYNNDADITAMLDSTEIHLLLQSNPDGRYVAETNQAAMRRKSMKPNTKKCATNSVGVDLNRNFPYQWGLTSGSSADACAETFRGTAASSEPEVQAIINYTKTIFPATQRKTDPQAPYNEATTMGVFVDVHSYSNLVLSPCIGYTAAGTTVDYAFKELGAAALTFELGTAFYQDCLTFENTIWPLNRQPLMLLAKISRAPYTMGQAPDVTALSASVSAGQVTITAAASDSAWSKSQVSTSQQAVAEIRAWVDAHPYSSNPGTGTVLTNGSVIVDISGLALGRHTVYVQATDSAGKRGPVTAAYFTK